MSRRYGGRYDSYWPRYVPVAERRAKAERELKKFEKKGQAIQPVMIEGRTIARTFWGKAWCDHLESFGDYSNRLPRGRSYVRNGSVCHLEIARGRVEAKVAGSSLYRVEAVIKPLAAAKWAEIKRRCAGRIGSLIELLQGKLSDEIMGTVTDRQDGLFPLPGEITYTCSCPDWADMCKHVSAVMYGIGARLDNQPELLFLLRGVDHHDLVSGETAAVGALAGEGSRRARRRNLAETDLASVFGVELEAVRPGDTPDKGGALPTTRKPAPRRTGGQHGERSSPRGVEGRAPSRPPAATRAAPAKQPAPFEATGPSIRELRLRQAMTIAEFARTVGVSPACVANWEKRSGAIHPHAKSLAGLQRLAPGSMRPQK